MDIFEEYKRIARDHVFDDDENPDLNLKLQSTRAFIHALSNRVEGESLPSATRSDMIKSLDKLYYNAIFDGFRDRSPSSEGTTHIE